MAVKDHILFLHALDWLVTYQSSVYTGIAAFVISTAFDIRDKRSFRHTSTGGIVCGMFALTTSAMLGYLGLPANSGAFIGSIIGFTGADKIRKVMLAFTMREAGLAKTEIDTFSAVDKKKIPSQLILLVKNYCLSSPLKLIPRKLDIK